MARSLADEGHEVGFLLASNAKIPPVIKDSAVQVVRYKVHAELPFLATQEASQLFVEAAFSESIIDHLKIMKKMGDKLNEHWRADCDDLLNDDGIAKHMADVNYDIAIMDNAGFRCNIALPYRINIPFILYGVLSMEWMYRDPTLPSFVPSLVSSFSDEMSFVARLQNTLIHLVGHIAMISINKDILPHTNPPALVMDVLSKGVFYFVLDDISIAYPRPLMPNIMYVGDIMPQPGGDLPHDIASFVDSAEEGVVIISFGSFFDFLPEDIAVKLCAAFKQIPQKVIWKLKNKSLCDADPTKVLLLDWLPQNDLLSHKNVVLFISHCGINSVLESIYHSTPIIGFPLSIDQPFNADRLQHRGLGYRMKIQDFTPDGLVGKISDIIHNETIKDNVARASQIMRNKPDTPTKRVSYWVQHLVEHGDNHLRTNAFKLNMFQFYCMDVMLALLGMLLVLIFIMFTCAKCIFRCMRYCCCSKKTKLD
jgi:hypothetical protein